MEDGNDKETTIAPELNLFEYVRAFDKLIKVNPDHYRKKKICDMEAKVRTLQAEISNENLLLQLQRLDETQGHLDVPEGVTHLSSVMWHYANKLRSIYIPASVDTINKHAISASSLESIEISPGNPYFCSDNNCILNKEKTRLLVGCKGSIVPDGVEEIEDSAFSDCCGLERIIIPSHVKKVGNRAFSGCTSLSKLIVEEGVEHLGFASFQGCTSLTDVTLPQSLEDMTDDAFKNTPWSGNVEGEDAWINDILG